MAYTAVAMPTSTSNRYIFRQHDGLHHAHSTKYLCSRANFDNQVSYSTTTNCTLYASKQAWLKEVKKAKWVRRLFDFRRSCRNKRHDNDVVDGDGGYGEVCDCEVEYDCCSFSRLLAQVSWLNTKLYSKLAFLCNMAHVIPELQAVDLGRHYNLHFVTSSLEKQAEAAALKTKLDHYSTRVPTTVSSAGECSSDATQNHPILPSAAFEIALSAASYVKFYIKDFLSPHFESKLHGDGMDTFGNVEKPWESVQNSNQVYESEVDAYMAAATMTSVVAAEEDEKKEAARYLQLFHSSPCEWFICDDLSTFTRCIVIQGSDSLESWKSNLLFEPTKFEGTEVLVHRGVYETAKGIYEQFMPEIFDHLNNYGDNAKLQFTGHSFGGSISLVVNLMLLTRKVVKPYNLQPVVTFGSPFVFCGGQKILSEFGLDEHHVHSVTMHRDIVPRTFSCNYPYHVASILKHIRPFQSHPCLVQNKLIYSPMGKIFILQPDEMSSPPHPLLPPGSALYALEKSESGSLTGALRTFLNSPHPLKTLRDPTSYGSEGTIVRDHDSSNYLKALNQVLRKQRRIASNILQSI